MTSYVRPGALYAGNGKHYLLSLQGNLTNDDVLIGLARKTAGVSAGFETNRKLSENLFRIREEKYVPCGFGVSLLR